MNGIPHESRPDDWQRLLGERAWLGALARQLVRRDEVADEAAHEALAAAWTRAVPGGVSARRWLAAILGKQLAGRRRAEHRRFAREQHAAAQEPAPPAADVVARFEVQRAVADAVVALPEPYRTTVLRRFWDDEAPAAIAAATRVPVETVRTRLKRGLAMLRERLDASQGGERRAWALPLWLATHRVDSLAMGLFLGVSLMTTLQKLVAAGIAAGLAVLLWTAVPPPATPHEVASAPGAAAPAPAAGNMEPGATQLLANERAEAPAVGEPSVPMATKSTFVVTGVVVDDATGAPLAGIPVRFVTWPRDEPSEPIAVSGADGVFSLGVASEPCRVRELFVQAPEYAFTHASIQFQREGGGASLPTRFDAGTLRLVRGTRLSGRVVDADGRGVAGAALLLPLVAIHYGGVSPQNMLGHAAVLGRTDAGGSFRLPHAVGPDVSHGNLLFAVAQAGIGWCRFEPSKRRSDTADLVVRLQPTGALRVVVLDAAGSPRAGVGVRAFPRFAPLGIENRAMPFGPAAEPACSFFHGRTDSSGVARLPLLPIGEAGFMRGRGTNERAYDLCLHADGYPAQPLLPCEVQPGAEVEVVARLVAARHVTVTAVVRDDAGAAIAHAAVEVRGDRTVRGKTDATGRAEFVIGGAPTVFVSATSDSHRSVQEQPFAIGSDAGFLTANLVLPRACPLDGVVVDQHGEPLPGAPLYLDRSPEAYTDGQGRFHIAEFPVGEHTLRVAPPAMDPTEWTGKQEPEVVDAARGPVRIVMQRRSGRADVRVAIVDTRSGEVLEPTDTVLRLFDVGQGRYLQRKNLRTEGGAVAADATPAGKWRLDVVTATGHRGSLTFELDETQRTCDLRLPLEPPGTLTGRVQFTGVAASGRVVVRVQHAVPDPHAYRRYRYAGRWVADAASQCVLEQQFGGTGDLTLQPASNPTFRLERVDPDQDLVLRAIGDGVAGELTVRVAPGGTSDVVLEVRPKGRY